MALIKLTAIVDNISGKLNGTVFARNKGGHYMRSKSNPVNPRTSQQMEVRSAFGAIASAWRSLSEAARNAWNETAADFPYQNRLGDTKTLSGFGLHQKLNRNIELAGGTAIEFPPTAQGAAGIGRVTLVFDDQRLQIRGTVFSEPGQTNKVLVYATPAISPGVSNFTNRLRLIQTSPVGGLIAGLDVTESYTANFGAPSVGQKIGIAVRVINENTGEASAMYQSDTFVEES